MSKCFCHLNGYEVKDSNARKSIESINNTLTEHSNSINSTNGVVEEHSNSINSINGTLDTHSNSINSINGTLDTHSVSINSINVELEANSYYTQNVTSKTYNMVAHTGCLYEAPSNSKPAFNIAIGQGFDCIECDINFSKDNVPVCIHDSTVDDMTNGTGEVSSFTFQELLELRIDNGYHVNEYSNLQIPSFEQFLLVCKRANVIPFPEIKPIMTEDNASTLVKIVKDYKMENICIFISFELSNLLLIKKYLPEAKTMYVCNLTQENVDICVENGIWGIDFNILTLSGELISYARSKGLKIGVWTTDSESQGALAFNSQVDYHTTNSMMFMQPYYDYAYELPTFIGYSKGLPIHNELVKRQYMNNGIVNLSRDHSNTINNYPDTYCTHSAIRCVCLERVYVKAGDVVNYKIPSGFKGTLHFFDANGDFITDLGWLDTSKTSYTVPANAAFFTWYGGRSNDAVLTEKDMIVIGKCFKSITRA